MYEANDKTENMEAKTNRRVGEIDISQLNLRTSPLSIVIARTTS